MRVAFVHTYPATAGMEEHEAEVIRRDRALATWLQDAEAGWSVEGFGCTTGRHAVEAGAADPYLRWQWQPTDGALAPDSLRGTSRSAALVEVVRAFEPDFVLLKGIGTPIADALVAAPRRYAAGGIIGGRFRSPASRGLQLALTENAEQDRFFRRRLGRNGYVRLPKLVEDVFFHGRDAQRRTSFDVVAVGAFQGFKNQQALSALRGHRLRIALVGGGPMRGTVEAAFDGGEAEVRFFGDVRKDEVAAILRASKVFVHPSRSEGFPRVVAEAMASALPVVALRGVVGEPVVSHRNGLLVDEPELAAAVLGLLADEVRRERMGRAAAQTALDQFSPERLADAVDPLAVLLQQTLHTYRSPAMDARSAFRRLRRQVLDTSGALHRVAAGARHRYGSSKRDDL